jgi:hypothetical protein
MTGTKKEERPKGPDIGLHQARRLCQLPEADRLAFFAEGLPVILESAQGFWAASRKLEAQPREAKVLGGFAEEEAAKILILMDAVRCPSKLLPSKLNRIVSWFYNHLARLIYAEAQSWKPMHVGQLREYVDQQRRGHYIDGYAGEYIMPNSTVYERESALYVDIEAYQDGSLHWSAPRDRHREHSSFGTLALQVAEAMQQVGMFTVGGLKATSEIWGTLEFRDAENNHDGDTLMEQLLTRLVTEKLPLHTAEQKHVVTLYRNWQLPMYNLDFSLRPVTLAELEAEQEREYWSMVGDPR